MGLGRIDVRVGIDPDEADLLALAAIELRDTGDGTGGDRMVAAEDDGRGALFERFDHQIGGFDAGLANFLQVLRVLLAGLLGFGDGRRRYCRHR